MWRKTAGSSPLARGTREIYRRVQVQQRLIPARAGNTYELIMGIWWNTAHPRSRGEHFAVMSARFARRGSSPLARGTHGDVEGYG